MTDSIISGIDVSSHQGMVDWDTVSQSGMSFAFIRATLGSHSADSRFAGNWTRARSARIKSSRQGKTLMRKLVPLLAKMSQDDRNLILFMAGRVSKKRGGTKAERKAT